MSTSSPLYPAFVNGRLIQDTELAPLAFAGFAHFTALQVRDGCIKGLDLHLQRLRQASLTLFGQALPDQQLLLQLKQVLLQAPADASLMLTMFSPSGEFTAQSRNDKPHVFIRTAPAHNGPKGPLRLSCVQYQRPLASIKHVGEVAKTYYLHQALAAGFDDAVFIDNKGRISEATIWNIAFWDGEAVIWPKAEQLQGTMMSIVQRQLHQLGIAQRQQEITLADLGRFRGAAVLNSWTPGVAVTAIGQHQFDYAAPFMAALARAYAAEPALSI